jgi:tetratricopeptide (TPR) repeat protein
LRAALLAIWGLTGGLSAVAGAAERVTVAVPAFRSDESFRTSWELGDALGEAVRGGLRGLRRVRLIEPGPLEQALERNGGRWEDAPLAALARAARDLSADVLVDGRFERAEEGIRLDVAMLDLARGTETRLQRASRLVPAELFAALEALTRALVAHLGISTSAREQQRLASAFARPTRSLAAYVSFAEGRRYATVGTREAAQRAVEAMLRAVMLDPTFARAHYELGLLFMQSNNRWRAAGEFRRAAQLDPTIAEVHKYLGDLFASSPRRLYGQAIEAYRRALELDPEYAEAYLSLADTLGAQGKPDEAIAAYRQALQLGPDDPRGYYGLGKVYQHEKGLHLEAIAAYRQALQADPRFLDAHVALGELFEETGRYEEAAASYERALEIDAAHPASLYGLALTLEQLDRGRAIRAWERYILIASQRSSERDWLDIAKQHLRRLQADSGERTDKR